MSEQKRARTARISRRPSCGAIVTGLAIAIASHGAPVRAGDWPTYLHDNSRSGITDERLDPPLSEEWVFESLHAPDPAWSPPQPKPVEGILELPRVRFDDAFHVAVAGGAVFFGSSSDNMVYALEAATGEIRWTFVTGGPVRLAPTAWQGRILVGSDDGFVYCLNGADGRLLWKFQAAPSDDRLLGHGKMISLWPVRTGVLVEDGVAYFAAGVFPGEGLHLYAVRAEDGKLIWKNDSFGQGGMREISPQGYMLISPTKLFVASGRSVPAAFDRNDGRFVFQKGVNRFREGPFGGTDAVFADGQIFSGTEQILAFAGESGAAGFAWFQGRRIVISSDIFYVLSQGALCAFDRQAYPPASRQRQDLKHQRMDLTAERRNAQSQLSSVRSQVQEAQRDLETLDSRLAGLRKAGAGTGELAQLKAKREARTKELRAAIKREADLRESLEGLSSRFKTLVENERAVAKRIADATRWRVALDCSDSLVLAGNVLFAGGRDQIVAVDAGVGEKLWQAAVRGKARGLAVADGRLLVSTDSGTLHCLKRAPAAASRRVRLETSDSLPSRDKLTSFYEWAAETILEETDIHRGYCLILGGSKGRLALELARRSDLMIYVVDPDAAEVESARKALMAAGLYGARVCVDRGPLHRLPYSDYFANLIICEAAFSSGDIPTPPRELLRLLKPLGGVAYIGLPGGVERLEKPLTSDRLREWLSGIVSDPSIARYFVNGAPTGAWGRIERGPLKGAGAWTHQYADPGNTACSDDRLVKCPLGLLWFGDPGPTRMVNRHSSAAAPLSIDGRLFVQGENVVMAYDAYNGLLLWERDIPGAMRTGLKTECGNLAASRDGLFVAVGDTCLRLDQRTGAVRSTYGFPRAGDSVPRRWGYVACADGLLYGSRTRKGLLADSVFAVNVESGERRWQCDGQQIMHSTIAVGDGRFYYVEKRVTEEQRQQALREGRQRPRLNRKGEPIHDVRLIVALDAASGRRLWERPLDVSDSVKISRGGGELAAIYKDQVLLLFSAPWNGHFWSEFFAGEFSRRSLIALSSRDGGLLWSGKIGYRSRPLVVGDTVYAEPWARDLHTGEPRLRVDAITGKAAPWQMARPGHHCGCMAASPDCLFFRSGSFGYYDLVRDYGTAHFSAVRPGCWINFIPASGVLLIPEGSSGCVCPFPIHCTVAFKHRETDRSWGLYSSSDRATPVERLGINFGAPGDRKDADGTLWLAYPRPRSDRLVFDMKLQVGMFGGGGYWTRNPDALPIEGTDTPWIFASGCAGFERCAIPIVGKGDPEGIYTVRLHFVETENSEPGSRVFDIKIQDRVALENFDVFKEAGKRHRAVVKEFKDIEVTGELGVELTPRLANPSSRALPSLSGIEIIRTKQEPPR